MTYVGDGNQYAGRDPSYLTRINCEQVGRYGKAWTCVHEGKD